MLGTDHATPVHFGKGLNPILSNLSPCPITYFGIQFGSVEAAYHAWKCGEYRPGYENLNAMESWRLSRLHGPCGKNPTLLYELMKQRWHNDPGFREALAKAGRITHPVSDSYWAAEFPRLLYRLRDEMVIW